MTDETICWVGTCTTPAHPAHDPCCSSKFHQKPLCCEHYRRAHFVETGCGHDEDAPRQLDRVTFDGREIFIHYEPDLPKRGMVFGGQTDNPTIILRVWDERVFLHELLHVALDRRLLAYHDETEWESLDGTLTSPRERIVGEVETALWEFGWRWSDRG